MVPTYLNIKPFTLNIKDPACQGASTENITDVWVFSNDQIIGGFELPATVPIMQNGAADISLRPGIKNSGAAELRIDYPFYSPHQFQTNLNPGEIIEVEPETYYYENLNFYALEDFEQLSIILDKVESGSVDVNITDDPDLVRSGDRSGRITMNADESFTARISNWVELPKGKSLYLEIDYHLEAPLEIQLIANTTDGERYLPVIVLYATEDWQKTYIDLGAIVDAQLSTSEFSILFYSLNTDSSPVNLYIDNLKLIGN